MKIIINLLVNGLAVWIAAYLLPGVHVDSFVTAIIVSVILGITNTFVKPVLVVLTLPITIMTLGLFYLIINGLMVLLVGSIVRGFRVDGFLWALLFSLVLSIVSSFLNKISK